MNKAELEAHVVKLERSVARLRKQNAELKQDYVEASARADTAESRKTVAKPSPKPAEKTVKKTLKKEPVRRAKASAVAPTDEAADGDEDAAETEE